MSSCLGTELARKLSMLRGITFFTYVCYMLLQVALISGVDSWLAELSKSINESLYFCIVDCVQDIESGQSIEEWISKVHVLGVLNTKKRFPQKRALFLFDKSGCWREFLSFSLVTLFPTRKFRFSFNRL